MKEKIKDYIVGNYSEEFFNQIWSDKNTEESLNLTVGSGKKVWFKCPKGVHEDEERQICNAVMRGFKCRQCSIIEQHLDQFHDLTGQKFDKWTVVEKDKENSKRMGVTYWFCDCDCGTKHTSVSAASLVKGTSRSCGCNRHENSGERNKKWKGGVTSEVTKQRNSRKYAKWRNTVFQRDDYTCQCCGQRGGKLNAHHIENFADNEDLRFDVNNGITLCEQCHSFRHAGSFHNIYGSQHNNRQQLEEYLRNNKLKSA